MEDNEMYEVDTIIMTEDDGSETEYAVLEKFDFEGKKYVVLSPIENDEVGDDDFLFSCEEDGDDLIVSSIDDDAEFDRVSKYLESLDDEA